MQLYCFRDRAITRALLDEAVEAGFEAVLLTVDAPYAGKRERDFRTGFEVPAEITAPAVKAASGGRDLSVQEVFDLIDPSLDWEDLAELVEASELPLLVKGLVRADDAELAVEHGAAGVVVSNHGGRQLDNAPATIDALPEVVDAVGGRIPVLMDGGIRRGTDVAVALALGADAVLAGRPCLWGLAWDGQAGAERALGSSAPSCGWRWPCSAAPRRPRSTRRTSAAASARSEEATEDGSAALASLRALDGQPPLRNRHVLPVRRARRRSTSTSAAPCSSRGRRPSTSSCRPRREPAASWCRASGSASSRCRWGSRTRSGPTIPSSTSAATSAISGCRDPGGSTSSAT